MLRTETKQIGEYTYKVTQLPGTSGRAVFLRFAKLVAPALAEIGAEEGQAVTKAAFVRALGKVAQTISNEDLDFFCDVFARSTDIVIVDEKTGKTREPKLSTVIAAHFAGDTLPDMFEWLYFCFEVNFGSFFGKLGAAHASTAAQTSESK